MNALRSSVRRLLAPVVGLAIALPLAVMSPVAAAPPDGVLRIVLFYKDNFHASHVQARQAVRDLTTELGTQYGQTVQIQETMDPAAFTTANLANVDAVVFTQTGGVLFDTAQRAALEGFIRGGGGFAGVHYTGWSVGQSEHDVNPFYLRLVGAMSEGHPENPGVRPGRVVVKAAGHPLTAGLGSEFTRSDEWYDWTVNPAPNVRTLLEADETSYGMGRQGSSHPITWCQTIDSGRSWYTGMGHEGTAYAEPVMRTQLKHGIAYAAGLLAADCSPPTKDQHGSFSGVTPWPLVPINMALTPDGKVQSFGSVGGFGSDTTPYDWTGNSTVTQGGQMEVDIWDPAQPRTVANVTSGLLANNTYTDLFCSMQVQNPHTRSTFTVGGDDGLGGNAPNDAAIGVTSYKTGVGLRNESPMNIPRWYPTGTTMPNGDIVVQGGSVRGGPGGPGVLTPEIYTPNSGNGWKLLTGATSGAAYGDGGSDHAGQDENRWWYPRAFVSPTNGNLFNITGTQMYELNPAGNGTLTLRGTLPSGVANQGTLGNPVGATSTAVMYRPGKILQVGGGWWANGGGPAGARAAFTVDITGGTASPVIAATDPMKFGRHWATGTMLPDGDVLVTGGSSDNNGNNGYVTNPEIWDPTTGDWTTIEVPYEHARLYHSSALLLPDGRVMVGGGGAPGPRNYTDVEYYSPSYLFDGNNLAPRPTVTNAPAKIGYGGTFQLTSSEAVSRVTLVRNGSVTHGFNNDQNFQDLAFTQSGGTVTINNPTNGNYAPPGSYMVFVWNAAGTPSVAKIVDIDPTTPVAQVSPRVVDQFEYPRLPTDWRNGNAPATIDVAAGNTQMSPWTVSGSTVQLVRGTVATSGGLGLTGYQLSLNTSGNITRTLTGLAPGTTYRIALKYARDSRTSGTTAATATLAVGSLSMTLTATTANPSQSGRAMTFATYSGTFTASATSHPLTLTATGGARMMIDDLIVVGGEPEVPPQPGGAAAVHFKFDENAGTTSVNSGTNAAVGSATLNSAWWTASGKLGAGVNLPGGAASTNNHVVLPNNLEAGFGNDFSVSLWANPRTLPTWVPLLQIGSSTDTFFLLQSNTQASGATGFGATMKVAGNPTQERLTLGAGNDLALNAWSHVVFTLNGSTGRIYVNGVLRATRTDFTIGIDDIGVGGNTTANLLGGTSWGDERWNGFVDDLRAYGRALTQQEVTDLYNPPAATVPVHFRFDENAGTTAANSGTNTGVGAATLNSAWWSTAGKYGAGVNLPGGAASTNNHVVLPNNLEAGFGNDFSVSLWANPRSLPTWVPLLQIGSSTDTFFLLQSNTQASGATGFGATLKVAGNPTQERLTLGAGNDLALNAWSHVVFTMSGTTGRIYVNGVLRATRTDFTIGIDDIGVGGNTTANLLGGTSWGDARWNGYVDDLRAYNRALTQAEVTTLFQA